MKTPGLQVRFVLVLLVSALLFSVVTGSIAYRIGFQRTLESGRQSIEDLARAVEKTAAVGAFAGDTVLMREVSEGLAGNRLVSKVMILDPAGHAMVHTGEGAPPASSAPTASAASQPTGPVFAPEADDVVRPLMSPFSRDEVIGRLVIHPNRVAMTAQSQREAWTLVGLLVLQVALVAWVMYLTAARFVSRPIVRLARELRTMSPGSTARLDVPDEHSADEIGELIAGANALLQANEDALDRERDLRTSVERMEAQYRQIFDSTSAGIFLLDRDGRLINGNPTVLKVMGATLGDVQQLRGEDFLAVAFAEPERVRDMVRQAADRRETVSSDLCLREQGGSSRWVHCLISVQQAEPAPNALPGDAAPEQQPMLIEGVMYDITERKRAEHQVRHQAEHDVLTGLKNRMASEDAIDRILAESAAGDVPASLLYIDLDGFKQVNDSLGHKAGDEVLKLCAERMRAVARRSTDVVGRIGGDEFLVVLPRVGPADPLGSQVAAALIKALSQPFLLSDGRVAHIGASIGIACYPMHGRVRAALAECADEALYAVKRSGKLTYAVAWQGRVAAPLREPMGSAT